MGFLPKDYKDPTTGSVYIKPSDLAEGSHKFRILSEPVMGWTYWTALDNKRKPNRVKDFKDVPAEFRAPEDNKDKAYYFWAFQVWNYAEGKAQIMEVRQSSIRGSIEELDADSDWGDVREYDIAINKSGKLLDTEYSVIAKPKTKFDKKGKEIAGVNLEALFNGADPFSTLSESQAVELAEAVPFEDLDLSDLDGQAPTPKV